MIYVILKYYAINFTFSRDIDSFSSFATNDAILDHMSRTCSIKKMWVLFQKKDKVSSSQSNWFSSSCQDSLPSSELTPDTIIPRPCFKPCFRSRVVHITIHTLSHELPMDLTPIVGKGLIDSLRTPLMRESMKFMQTPLMKEPVKRSLGFNVPKSTKRPSALRKALHCTCNDLLATHPDKGNGRENDSEVFPKVCEKCGPRSRNPSFACSPHLTRFSFSPCTPSLSTNRHSVPIVETPVVSSVSRKKMTSSTGSPSRLLVSKIDGFRLTDAETEEAEELIDDNSLYSSTGKMWYLIDRSIVGFKSKAL